MAANDAARIGDVEAGFKAADARMDLHAGRLAALESDSGGGGVTPPFAISDTIGLQQALEDRQPLDSDLTAISLLSTTAFGRALLTLADAATGRTTFGLGTAATAAAGEFQPADADLTAIAALTTTSYGRGLLTLANVAALKTSLSLAKADVGLGNVDNTSDAGKPVSTAQQAALDLKANLSDTIISVTTSRALATTDNGAVLEVNSASAVTLTVPSTLPIGFNCIVSQVGAGQVTVAAGTSATVTALGGAKTPGQWGEVAVRVRGTAGAAVVSGGVA